MLNIFYFLVGMIGGAFLLVPAMASAQTGIQNILTTAGDLLNALIPLLITLALVFFFWGLAKFILNAGDSEGRKQGVSIMIFGILALFVMVSVWGLVGLLQDTLGIEDAGPPETPGINDVPELAPES